jgi:hypothetical protein
MAMQLLYIEIKLLHMESFDNNNDLKAHYCKESLKSSYPGNIIFAIFLFIFNLLNLGRHASTSKLMYTSASKLMYTSA